MLTVAVVDFVALPFLLNLISQEIKFSDKWCFFRWSSKKMAKKSFIIKKNIFKSEIGSAHDLTWRRHNHVWKSPLSLQKLRSIFPRILILILTDISYSATNWEVIQLVSNDILNILFPKKKNLIIVKRWRRVSCHTLTFKWQTKAK